MSKPAFRRAQSQGVSHSPIIDQRAEFSSLESRLLLNADPVVDELAGQQSHLAYDAAADITALIQAGPVASLGATAPGVALGALSTIPMLNSDPDATAQLYLDFDGDLARTWGDYGVPVTPAFDRDGNATTFSSSELAAIEEIWGRVAEKYSPFNLNVTTVNPGALSNRVALRVVIGGDGAWCGMAAGGIAYVGSFQDYSPNTVYVFPDNLGNGEPKFVAEAAAHEAGHGFGLEHQSSYGHDGQLLAEYYAGTSSVAPIMGNSYDARGVWWRGTTISSLDYQYDLAVLASLENGFGYRADDHGNTLASASTMSVQGSTVAARGIVERMKDLDSFAFSTGAGTVRFSINVAAKGAMLDLKAELWKADGTLVAVADTTSLGETLTANVSAGSYRLVVSSHGRYGDLGQYTIAGSIVPGMAEMMMAPEAPSGLTTDPRSQGRMVLTWNGVGGATGYIIERSSDGAKWSEVGNTAETITWYTDRGLTPGARYYYRIRSVNAGGQSAPSPVIRDYASAIAVPTAPVNVQMMITSNNAMRLVWQDKSSCESGFRVQWSPDGRRWYGLGYVAANRTGVNVVVWRRGTTYFRVSAYNQYGESTFSKTTSTATATRVSSGLAVRPANVFSTRFIGNQETRLVLGIRDGLAGWAKAA